MLGDYQGAENSAAKEAEKTANSWEGNLNKIKNSWTKTVANMTDTDWVKDILAMIVKLIDGLSKLTSFIGKLGGLKSIATIGISLFAAFNSSKILGFFTRIPLLIGSFSSLNAVTTVLNANTTLTGEQFEKLQLDCMGLTNAQMQLVLSSNVLTAEQAESILVSRGLSEAEVQQQLATLSMSRANAAASTSTGVFKGALQGLWTTMKANPIGLIIAVATSAYMIFKKIQSDQQQRIDDAIETAKTVSETASNLTNLYNQYNQLSGISERTTEQDETYKSVQDSIISSLGDRAKALDDLTVGTEEYEKKIKELTKTELESQRNKLSSSIEGLEDNTKKTKVSHSVLDIYDPVNGINESMSQKMVSSNTLDSNGFLTFGGTALSDYPKAANAMKILDDELNKLYASGKKAEAEVFANSSVYQNVKKAVDESSESFGNLIKAEIQQNELTYIVNNGTVDTAEKQAKLKEYLLENVNSYGLTGESLNSIIDKYGSFNDKTTDATGITNGLASGMDGLANSTDETADSFKKLKDSIGEAVELVSKFDTAISDIKLGKGISRDDMWSFVDVDPSLATKFKKVSDGYSISVDDLVSAKNKYIESSKTPIQDSNNSLVSSIDSSKAKIQEYKSKINKMLSTSSSPNSTINSSAFVELNNSIKIEENNITKANSSIDKNNLLLSEFGDTANATSTYIANLNSQLDIYNTRISDNLSTNDTVTSALKEQAETGRISSETLQKLKSTNLELTGANLGMAVSFGENGTQATLLQSSVESLMQSEYNLQLQELENQKVDLTTKYTEAKNALDAYNDSAKTSIQINNAADALKYMSLLDNEKALGKSLGDTDTKLAEFQYSRKDYLDFSYDTSSTDKAQKEAEKEAKTAEELAEEKRQIQIDGFESEKKDLDHLLAMNVISEKEYYIELNRLNEEYYSDLTQYSDEYRKNEEDIYSHLIDMKKKNIQDEINSLKEKNDEENKSLELQKAIDAYNNAKRNKSNKVYDQERGWIWETDREAVTSAKTNLDNLLFEKQIDYLEKISDSLDIIKNTGYTDPVTGTVHTSMNNDLQEKIYQDLLSNYGISSQGISSNIKTPQNYGEFSNYLKNSVDISAITPKAFLGNSNGAMDIINKATSNISNNSQPVIKFEFGNISCIDGTDFVDRVMKVFDTRMNEIVSKALFLKKNYN